jgi:hypothetical protein
VAAGLKRLEGTLSGFSGGMFCRRKCVRRPALTLGILMLAACM